jgi:hypothetical protein
MITILYSLWIAYTVGSLSIIGFLIILSIIAKYEKKRWNKKLAERMKVEYKEEEW